MEAQYYMFKDIAAFKGAGRNPDLLKKLTSEQIQFLPGCTLSVAVQNLGSNGYRFRASLPDGHSLRLYLRGAKLPSRLGI